MSLGDLCDGGGTRDHAAMESADNRTGGSSPALAEQVEHPVAAMESADNRRKQQSTIDHPAARVMRPQRSPPTSGGSRQTLGSAYREARRTCEVGQV